MRGAPTPHFGPYPHPGLATLRRWQWRTAARGDLLGHHLHRDLRTCCCGLERVLPRVARRPRHGSPLARVRPESSFTLLNAVNIGTRRQICSTALPPRWSYRFTDSGMLPRVPSLVRGCPIARLSAPEASQTHTNVDTRRGLFPGTSLLLPPSLHPVTPFEVSGPPPSACAHLVTPPTRMAQVGTFA